MFGLSPFSGAPLSTLPGLWHRADHAAGEILTLNSLTKRGVLDVPTVMEIRYTDTSALPWRERSAIAKLPGVDEGTTPRRESVVRLPGIHTYAPAYREAVERLNKLNLGDLEIDLSEFDSAIAIEVGDVREVTHPIGLTYKRFRITRTSGERGRYRWTGSEYDPAMYSDEVQTGPSQTDTTLPSPMNPAPATGLALAEDRYQLRNETWASRLVATWTASTSPYVEGYRIELLLAGVIVDSATILRSATMRYTTPTVEEGVQYTVRVYALTSVAASVAATAVATPLGKFILPDDVASLSGFEAGGTVFLNWPDIADDRRRFELRYGLVSATWEEATVLDLVDALRYQTKQIPVGDWRIFIKAIDSVKQESVNATTLDLTVTLDNAAFLADSIEYDTPTLTRMSAFTLGRTDATLRAVTEDGVAFGTKFPNPLATYVNPLASYSSAGASSWVSESHDFGTLISGDWSAEITGEALSGAVTKTLELSEDGMAWTPYTALSAKASARFARVRLDAAGTSVIYARAPTMHVRINVVPRSEQGFVVTNASGPTTISLANIYTAAKSIQVTPLGTVSRQAVYDNVLLGNQDYFAEDYVDPAYIRGNVDTFDIYLFNLAGAQIAGEVSWRFEGV